MRYVDVAPRLHALRLLISSSGSVWFACADVCVCMLLCAYVRACVYVHICCHIFYL